MNKKRETSRIKIETIIEGKTGIKLLEDEESFMHELGEEEIEKIQGGIQGSCITLCDPYSWNTINTIR